MYGSLNRLIEMTLHQKIALSMQSLYEVKADGGCCRWSDILLPQFYELPGLSLADSRYPIPLGSVSSDTITVNLRLYCCSFLF